MRPALSPCSVSGCPQPAVNRGRCQRHSLAQAQEQRRSEPPRLTRQQMGYGQDWTEARAYYIAHNPCCVVCGGGPIFLVHHMVEVRQGGTHEQGNLAGLCKLHANSFHRRGWYTRQPRIETRG